MTTENPPAAVGNDNDGRKGAGDLADSGGRNRNPFSDWPWGAQFAAVMTVLVLASFLLIVMPVLGVMRLNESSGVTDGMEVWGTMLAALLGLTTMTISAIFLFMTLRIDRGARAEARKAAEKEMRDATKKAEEAARSAIDGAIKTEVGKAHDAIDETVKEANEKIANRIEAVDEMVSRKISERISDTMDDFVAGVNRRLIAAREDVVQRANEATQRIDSRIAALDESMARQMNEATQRIDSRVGTVDDNLAQRLSEATQRFDNRVIAIDENLARRLDGATERIDGRVLSIDENMDKKLTAAAEGMDGRMETLRSGLASVRGEVRSLGEDVAGIDRRMEDVERRVTKLEPSRSRSRSRKMEPNSRSGTEAGRAPADDGTTAGAGIPVGLGLLFVLGLNVFAVLGVLVFLDAPAAPRLSAQPGDGSVTLRWTGDLNHMNVGGWQVQMREAGREYGDWEVVDPVSDPPNRTLTHGVGNLQNGWTYVFRVRVKSRRDGVSPPSNEAIAAPTAAGAIGEQVAGIARRIADPYCEGRARDVGTVEFAVDSAALDCDSGAGPMQAIVGMLNARGAKGLVLVVGRATPDGAVVGNLDLSERRSNAVITCLEERVRTWRGRLEFREVVEGENYGETSSERSARVVLCEGAPTTID